MPPENFDKRPKLIVHHKISIQMSEAQLSFNLDKSQVVRRKKRKDEKKRRREEVDYINRGACIRASNARDPGRYL